MTRALLLEINNYFDLFPKFIANLTATLSTGIKVSDVLAIMNRNSTSIPSPLDCIVDDLQDLKDYIEDARNELLEIISETNPSKFGESGRILVQNF